MSETDKAKRAIVGVGSLEIEGCMMSDGSCRMSQWQAVECAGTTLRNATNFLCSRAFKAFQGDTYTDQNSEQLRQNGIGFWQSKGGDRS